MYKEFHFRSAVFGGFNKQDVMAYLAALNDEKADLHQKYTTASNDASLFLKRITELEAEVSKIADLNEQLDAEKLKSDNLEKDNAQLVKENELNLTKLSNLEAEKDKLASDCAKLKAVESQLGAAMLDARLYSERLVSEASGKVSAINKETGEAITKTAGKIGELSGNISELATSFNKALAELETKVRLLVSDMTNTADELIKNQTVTAQNPSPSPEKSNVGAEQKSDSTDNDSGSVYLFGTT